VLRGMLRHGREPPGPGTARLRRPAEKKVASEIGESYGNRHSDIASTTEKLLRFDFRIYSLQRTTSTNEFRSPLPPP
jgi:hypothetical protein